MIDRKKTQNAFEFVTLASARAHQLLRGCTPRTSGSEKPAKLAALEVKQGHVRRLQAGEEE